MSDLETFLLEPANRSAATAGQAVADATGLPFAPLLVQGPPGSGKSDLLEAISRRLRARHPGAKIEQLGADALAERYRTALVLGRGDACRAQFLAAELLLLDDLERLARHRDCQGLVADLLDARRGAGRETVIATGRPLAELDGLDARLSRRLTEGTTVHLALPGVAARREILRRRIADGPGSLPSDVVEALAEVEFPSMRDYIGALARLVAFQQASATPLTPVDAMALIGAPAPMAPPRPVTSAAAPDGAPAAAAPTTEDFVIDEFGAFLSEVEAGVSEQVDRWRRRVGEAVLRWGGEGFRTRRLEALLGEDVPGDPEPVLSAFEADVRSLRALAAEMETLAPDLAGAEVFRDPDQLAAARELIEQARASGVPLSTPLPQYRLDDLALGPASRTAMEAIQRHPPGRTPRHPALVIVGGPGLGKTHLLHGVGNALAAGSGAGRLPGRAGVRRGGLDAAQRRRPERVAAALSLGGRAAARRSPSADQGVSRAGGAAAARGRADRGPAADGVYERAPRSRIRDRPRSQAADAPAGRPARAPASTRPRDEAGGDQATPGRNGRGAGRRPRGLFRRTTRRFDARAPGGGAASPSARRRHSGCRRVPRSRARCSTWRARSPSAARRSGSARASGILSPGIGLVKSREKMIDEWPVVADRSDRGAS